MNRRNFIIGAAIFPVAISLPISLIPEDPYDRFLVELRDNVMRHLEHTDGRLQKLWIDPVKDYKQLVHIIVGGKPISWYQSYGG